MADVLVRTESEHLAAHFAYTVQPRDSGWVLEIEGTPGVRVEQFVETEAEAHVRAAQLTAVMWYGYR